MHIPAAAKWAAIGGCAFFSISVYGPLPAVKVGITILAKTALFSAVTGYIASHTLSPTKVVTVIQHPNRAIQERIQYQANIQVRKNLRQTIESASRLAVIFLSPVLAYLDNASHTQSDLERVVHPSLIISAAYFGCSAKFTQFFMKKQ